MDYPMANQGCRFSEGNTKTPDGSRTPQDLETALPRNRTWRRILSKNRLADGGKLGLVNSKWHSNATLNGLAFQGVSRGYRRGREGCGVVFWHGVLHSGSIKVKDWAHFWLGKGPHVKSVKPKPVLMTRCRLFIFLFLITLLCFKWTYTICFMLHVFKAYPLPSKPDRPLGTF